MVAVQVLLENSESDESSDDDDSDADPKFAIHSDHNTDAENNDPDNFFFSLNVHWRINVTNS